MSETAIAEYSPIERDLAQMRHELKDRVYDLTTEAGEKEARTDLRFCVKMRTTLEASREELKAPVLARGRLIDSEAKRIRLLIEAVEDPIAGQLAVIDDARAVEQERRRAEKAEALRLLRKKIVDTFTVPAATALNADSLVMRQTLDRLEAVVADGDSFGDLVLEAAEAKTAAIEMLAPALAAKLQAEVTAREAAEQRQVEAEKKRVADAAKLEEAETLAKQKAAEAAAKETELVELRAKVAEQTPVQPKLDDLLPPIIPPTVVVSDPAEEDAGVISISVRRMVRLSTSGRVDLSFDESLKVYHGVLGIVQAIKE